MQFLSVWATVVCIILLLAALVITYLRAVRTREPADGWLDGILIDVVTGLHLGWVALATVANIAAALTATVPADWESAASVVGVIVLIVIVVAAVALGISASGGWRIAPVLSIAWGLGWLAVARLLGDLVDVPIGITAIIVAVVVIIVPVVGRLMRERTLAD
ncbi:hypothetical protein [Microbacterium sp. UBA1097]|uniref:hypothetical protein n=1 Tax=Microbacterium sp. UBA1097 TaxID=1946941 RepID=UPI0025F2BCD5|nr:hypothetical protein [Microbacterium sp. UBA1097]